MAEIYVGTKFKYLQKGNTIQKTSKLETLKKWCGIFNDNKFAPPYDGGSSGNLSFRTEINLNNFIITASKTALNNKMSINDFSEVVYCSINDNEVHANGTKEPSSETLMHYLIYKKRNDINAIFHGHSNEIMEIAKQKGFNETSKEFEYGTIELAKIVVETLENNNFVILKNHGFISVGKTQEEAGNLVLSLI